MSFAEWQLLLLKEQKKNESILDTVLIENGWGCETIWQHLSLYWCGWIAIDYEFSREFSYNEYSTLYIFSFYPYELADWFIDV